jgi:hypothetical protein
MRGRRNRYVVAGVLALSLCLAAGLAPGTAGAKGKSKKGSATANVTVNGNLAIPTAPSATARGILTSTATIGKKFKGKQIGDVNITLTGGASGAGSSINSLTGRLTAPNGATVSLFSDFLFGQVLGPLTLDDETPFFLNGGATPSPDPDARNAPYAGTAQANNAFSIMDGGPARGTWTLRIRNEDTNATHLHALTQWSLQVRTHPPFVTK